MKHLVLIGILIVLYSLPTFGQQKKTFLISGSVFDKETREPLNYAQMVSYKTGQSYTIDTDGHFFFYINKDDSVKIVSMKYEPKVMKAENFLQTKGPDSIYLKPASYPLDEVTVKARDGSIRLNLPDNIGEKVDPDAQPDRTVSGPSIGMIDNPATLAYSVFSRKAKRQRRLKKQIQKEKERALWNNILQSDLLETWTGLNEKELENFIIFCNKRIHVTRDDTYLSIQKKVMDLLNIYQSGKE